MYEEFKMKFKAFFLCIIFLTSCKSFNSDIEFFEAKKYTDWFFTHKIKLFNKHYFNTNQVIRRPVLSWQLLAKLDVLGAGGNIDFSDCVFFKVPYSDSKKEGINENGKIKIIKIKKNIRCEDTGFDKEGFVLNEIKNLKVFFSPKKIINKFLKKTIPPFNFVLKFESNKKDHWLFFPLGNINPSTILEGKNKGARGHLRERYSSSETQGSYPGLLFWPEVENKNKNDFRLGNKSQKYSEGSALKCETWSENCQKIGNSTCHRCRWGWYEVVGGKCSAFNDRYCGQDNCGKRGWPACFKGKESFQMASYKGHCFSSKERAFCQDGLEKVCDGSGVVVCL